MCCLLEGKVQRVRIPLVRLPVTDQVTVLAWNHVAQPCEYTPANERTLTTVQQECEFQEGKRIKQFGEMLRHCILYNQGVSVLGHV